MKRMPYLLTALLALLLAACGPSQEPTPVPEATLPAGPETTQPAGAEATLPAGEEAYPAPAEVAAPTSASDGEAYPPPTAAIPTPAAYPPPTLTPAQSDAYPPPRPTPNETKRFIINPARIGEEEVSGTGFPNTAIKIISISYAGEELGFGTINADRSFVIRLSRPLSDEVIGISLADNSQVPEFLDAPGTDIPMIGLVFDQRVVAP